MDAITLDSAAEFIVDCQHKTAPTQSYGTPLIRTPNIGKGRFNLEKVQRISADVYEKWTIRGIPEKGDLILAREAPAGNVAIIKSDEPYCLGQRTVHIRPNKKIVDPDFLVYFMLAPKQQANLLKHQVGVTVGHVNMKDIRRLPLENLPALHEQKKLAVVISNYDDLIENNRRRIQLLEESAHLLYKEWFVHLRFPGHEHVKIIDGVPEGWSSRPISELSAYLSRGMTPKYNDEGEFQIINQKCIRGHLLNMDLARRQVKEYNVDKGVRKGDVLINSTGTGTLGRVAQVWSDLRKTTVDTHVTIVRPIDNVPYLWLGFALMRFEAVFEGMGEGATNQKELKRAMVGEVKLLLPDSMLLLKEFHELTKDTVEQIQVLIQCNKRLVEARDILLPRLMNGELTV